MEHQKKKGEGKDQICLRDSREGGKVSGLARIVEWINGKKGGKPATCFENFRGA